MAVAVRFGPHLSGRAIDSPTAGEEAADNQYAQQNYSTHHDALHGATLVPGIGVAAAVFVFASATAWTRVIAPGFSGHKLGTVV